MGLMNRITQAHQLTDESSVNDSPPPAITMITHEKVKSSSNNYLQVSVSFKHSRPKSTVNRGAVFIIRETKVSGKYFIAI